MVLLSFTLSDLHPSGTITLSIAVDFISKGLDLPVKPEATFSSLEMPEVELEPHYLLAIRKWMPKPYLKSMLSK